MMLPPGQKALLTMLAAVLFCSCSDAAQETGRAKSHITVVGKLQAQQLDEASGLAASIRHPGKFWTINDDGPPILYFIDDDGAYLGQIGVRDAKNTDWEDLASFTLDGVPYLLIADIGNNESKREYRTLYVLEEPGIPVTDPMPWSWRIDYRYADGARDAEAIAVDTENNRILILSKRDIPAALYELPLRPGEIGPQVATRIGVVDRLPQPDGDAIRNAVRRNKWDWQPTGMDIAPDGSAIAILTYAAVYYFERLADQDWAAALQMPPTAAYPLGKFRNAESIAFSNDSRSVLITLEQQHAPVLRIEPGATRQ